MSKRLKDQIFKQKMQTTSKTIKENTAKTPS